MTKQVDKRKTRQTDRQTDIMKEMEPKRIQSIHKTSAYVHVSESVCVHLGLYLLVHVCSQRYRNRQESVSRKQSHNGSVGRDYAHMHAYLTKHE